MKCASPNQPCCIGTALGIGIVVRRPELQCIYCVWVSYLTSVVGNRIIAVPVSKRGPGRVAKRLFRAHR